MGAVLRFLARAYSWKRTGGVGVGTARRRLWCLCGEALGSPINSGLLLAVGAAAVPKAAVDVAAVGEASIVAVLLRLKPKTHNRDY